MQPPLRHVRAAAAIAVLGAALIVAAPSSAAADDLTISVDASADTYVSAASPTKAYGASTTVYADADPTKQVLLRFDVSGLGGATVQDVKLRLHQVEQAKVGGRVWSMSSTSWSEAATTWNNRPAVDGALLGSFGAVTANTWYEVSLGPIPLTDGPVSLVVDSTSTDGSHWASRETATPPQLVITATSMPPAPSSCAPTQVAAPVEGSSNPTRYASNHKVARTAQGRVYAVHGRHARGQQLRWQDAGSAWQSTSRGAVTDGMIADGTGTGDLSSSLDLVRGTDSSEHGWLVWSGNGSGDSSFPVVLRHLSDLESPSGPTVGPALQLAPAAIGTGRADIVTESSGATSAVIVTWTRKVSSGVEVVVARISDVTSEAPSVEGPYVVQSAAPVPRISLLRTAAGSALVTRTSAGRLRVLRHTAGTPLTSWTASVEGVAIASGARVNAVELASGDILAIAERDTTQHITTVQRFDPSGGTATVELDITGYLEPSLATNGTSAWLLAVRAADGAVVSRQRADSPWTDDRVEIGGEAGSSYEAPNPLRVVGSELVFIVRGSMASPNRAAVLACIRPA